MLISKAKEYGVPILLYLLLFPLPTDYICSLHLRSFVSLIGFWGQTVKPALGVPKVGFLMQQNSVYRMTSFLSLHPAMPETSRPLDLSTQVH